MAKKKVRKAPTADTLLVELLTEELPPKALKHLSEAFAAGIANGLQQRGLVPPDGKVVSFATPRRLAVCISSAVAKGVDKPVEQKLMPLSVASGPDGRASNALRKKLASMGRAHLSEGFPQAGDGPDSLYVKSDGKGESVFLSTLQPGSTLASALQWALQDSVEKLPIPKTMSYQLADGRNENFVRPAHGLLALHGDKVVPVSVLGLKATSTTRGHRFLSGRAIALKHANDYEHALYEEGKVIADFDKRRAEIIEQLGRIAGTGATFVVDDTLLDEVTALVESPAVHAGVFNADFLDIPQECLILSMQQHQKYVPLRDKKTGKLLPRFLFVSNLRTRDPREIIRGNERVLRARLSDARFFYDQDRKVRLEERVPQLANVVYHSRLGSQLQRVERIQLLAGRIARELGADTLLAERAAWLSKADLLTGMVGEFPELQGVMGRYYALHDGEPKEVADAIEAHYRPRFAGDALPAGKIACAVALADKLEALAGLFGIGQQPGGDKDPFALRRAALGVIRILVERSYPLSLNELVSAAFSGHATSVGDASANLESFIFDRFSGYLKDRGYSTLEVDAVLGLLPMRLDLVPRQLEAVRAFLALPESESLAAANKRIRNILQKSPPPGSDLFSETKLVENEERRLYHAYLRVDEEADRKLKQGEFTDALTALAALKDPVDAFFDHVMVNVDDAGLRDNRLLLLMRLESAMNRVADISKLAA